MNSNDTTWLFFKGNKYLLSGDHQKKGKKRKSPTDSRQSEPQEPEGKKKKKKDGEDFESRSVEHWCFLGNPDLVHHMR